MLGNNRDYLWPEDHILFEKFDLGLMLMDEKGQISFINKPGEAILGSPHTSTAQYFSSEILSILKNNIPPKGKKQNFLGPLGIGNKDIWAKIASAEGERTSRWIAVLFFSLPTPEKWPLAFEGAMSSISFHKKNDPRQDWKPRYSFGDIIGQSQPLQEVKLKAARIAKSSSTIMILGESGTGKELFAHAIHRESPRAKQPFIRVACSSVPSELLEAELFGYDPGSFTGADRKGRSGKFELANKGTIFLDEIGDMSLEMQSKLLRVLQEKEVVRIGGIKPIPVDFRLITATNKDLGKLVTDGQFRMDLYFRLNVLQLRIPPLRDRKSDLPLLIRFFQDKWAEKYGRTIRTQLHPKLTVFFKKYSWPGNIRELMNILEWICTLHEKEDENVIGFRDLPPYLVSVYREENKGEIFSLEGRRRKAEKEAILDVLNLTQGNKTKAAKMFGIQRSTLYEKMKKYGIE